MLRTRRKQAATKERLRKFIAKTTTEEEPGKTGSFQQKTSENNTSAEVKTDTLCNKRKPNTNGGLYWTYQLYNTTNTIVEYSTLTGLVEILTVKLQTNTWPTSPNFIQRRRKTIMASLDFREFSVYPLRFW